MPSDLAQVRGHIGYQKAPTPSCAVNSTEGRGFKSGAVTWKMAVQT